MLNYLYSYMSWVWRFARRFVLSPEYLLVFVLTFALIVYLFGGDVILRIATKFSDLFDWNNEYQYRLASTVTPDITTEKSKASWELRKDNVGVFAIQGRRPYMEDRFNVVTDLEHTETSIYGIFDGHGGEFAADYAEKTLFKTIMVRLLKAVLADEKENFTKLLTEEILSVDKQLLQVETLTNEVSGSTALVALLHQNKLTVANVGDSRGVICDSDGNAVPLSFDHKPQQLKERKRIKAAGGFISFNGVWRVAGVLATSRALGDFPLKDRNLVIAEPDCLEFDLDKMKPRFMILATDGLWDVFTNEEAVAYIKERLDEPHYGAKSIVLQAYYRGSLDNITVMVVNFKAKSTKTKTNVSSTPNETLIAEDPRRE